MPCPLPNNAAMLAHQTTLYHPTSSPTDYNDLQSRQPGNSLPHARTRLHVSPLHAMASEEPDKGPAIFVHAPGNSEPTDSWVPSPLFKHSCLLCIPENRDSSTSSTTKSSFLSQRRFSPAFSRCVTHLHGSCKGICKLFLHVIIVVDQAAIFHALQNHIT